MVGRYAIPEADITITHHLPPPEDDSTQDVSMSFVIPPQADASNLLDQNYDDFFSGPGFTTLSTPVIPRHLTNAMQSGRKAPGTIRTPAVVSGPIFGQSLPTHSTAELELPNDRVELQETHIPPSTKPFMSMGPPATASAVGVTPITEPDSPRPSDAPLESDPDARICDGPKSNAAPSVASVITTKASRTRPGIQSTLTSAPSRHSSNAQNTQISRQFPTPGPQKKNKGPAQARGQTSAKSNEGASKLRGGNVPDCETTTAVSRV